MGNPTEGELLDVAMTYIAEHTEALELRIGYNDPYAHEGFYALITNRDGVAVIGESSLGADDVLEALADLAREIAKQ